MNILIVNQPLNNRGDESAHKGLVRRLSKQYPKAEINVLFVCYGNFDNTYWNVVEGCEDFLKMLLNKHIL